MTLEELDKPSLRALDYILNYQPDTRVKYTLEEDTVEKLLNKGLIRKKEEKDDYSNYYDVLSIRENRQEEVKGKIKQEFDNLYPNHSEENVREIFQDNVGGMFAFFSEVRTLNRDYVRATHRIPASLLKELEDAGFGFHRHYLTTTDNIKHQFVFRTSPFNGREKFSEVADSAISSHLEGLTQIEKWAIYVKSAVGTTHITSNPGKFSPERLEEIKDKPSVKETGDEDLEFIKEDIKDYLRSEIYKFLEEDPYYFSILEYLNIRSDRNGAINEDFLEDIGNDKRQTVESCLSQLVNKGVILQRGESKYTLTDQTKEILDVIEKRTIVLSYPIRTPREGQEILYDIMEDAEEEIKIIDRFFDEDALDLVRTVVPKREGLDLHILTAVNNERIERLADACDGATDTSRYKIKSVPNEEEAPHDRFIIVDGEKIWQLGHSLNGLGQEFSTIFLHSEEESGHYRELFNSLWERADSF
jgi:predicted transcriptional regulator